MSRLSSGQLQDTIDALEAYKATLSNAEQIDSVDESIEAFRAIGLKRIKPLRVLVCGDRHWSDIEEIRRVLKQIHAQFGIHEIIHGAAKGADKMAAAIAHQEGWYVTEVPAMWERDGNAAGIIRNKFMLDTLLPDVVVAFFDGIADSKGTKHMIEYANAAGVPVRLYASSERRKDYERRKRNR